MKACVVSPSAIDFVFFFTEYNTLTDYGKT